MELSTVSSPLVSRDRLLAAFGDFLNLDVGAGDAALDTVQTYRRQVQQFLGWCDRHNLDPGQLVQDDIKRYRYWLVQDQQFKPATVALKLSVVRRFYQAAVNRGLVPFNPALGVRPPREKRDPAERITFLETSEVERLLAAVPWPDAGITPAAALQRLRDRALLAIMALEGPRTVELHRANVVNVLQQGQNYGIRVEGKRNIRIVPLTPDIAQVLMAYLDMRRDRGERFTAQTPLFIAVGNRAKGKRLSRRGIRLIVDRHLTATHLKHAAGRTISAHSLRHTAGTLALRAGAELRQVQDLLGHADPRTTCIYAHVADRWENNPALKLGIEL
ncbi:tyrosine-type recombinase/integrase [Spirulina major CS-329]|uniref:tyrosine-type recombinase/integrase n=1 Tax=Spirulina TaxID=1154 RepID=UPI00232FA717|nr:MULTISPECIES: tyrosine-type recombinase/integrase [Spirulina]MDB9493574.1 tyrosine-type recombinase/integrase [Spirulina subsalsa CS-330]MDB9504269.1 tyrosine-type recombinase/integrase [Spirulina major CS-329]